jgi:hypothetical protein
MALSIFEDKSVRPDDQMLAEALQASYKWWQEIKEFVIQQYPQASEEWNHSGKNYGWGFRLKDKKRAIIYLTPSDKFFLFSVVFGKKATQEALHSNISEDIKKIINEAPVYAEGRGIRLEIRSAAIIADLKKLILIKLQN